MNYIKNDKREMVVAVGAPGSLERVKVEYPLLIEDINNMYFEYADAYGRGIDKVIDLIRERGIKSKLETRNLILASNYSNERAGSVVSLVLSV